MIWLRSLVFLALQIVITPLFFFAMLLSMPFGHRPLYALVKGWTGTVVSLARALCGIDYRVLGREHIPARPSIVLSKHQSAWETFFFLHLFPTQVWLLKRELLRIPFFGWGLAMLRPISIDRAARFSALKQLVKEGRERLASGLWVVIFPEGTRMPPGQAGDYASGGAMLATHSGAPVLPVALNSGEFWSKRGILKRPGVITVSIGAPIDSRGLKPNELNDKVKTWIETEMSRIANLPSYRGRAAGHSVRHEAGEPLS